jgi:hypothetical protein
MGLLARFLSYSQQTYGGAPLLLIVMLVQLALLGWVVSARLRGRIDRNSGSAEERRLKSAARAEIWNKRVRPMALTMMLLGPGIGLGMSTLLGALGMGSLSDAMASPTGAEHLAQTMAIAYRDISYAYFLMVGGTFPMLLGPVIVLAAHGLEEEGMEARGGDPDEVLLHTMKTLLTVSETQAVQAQRDAAKTHALLEQLVSSLSRWTAS